MAIWMGSIIQQVELYVWVRPADSTRADDWHVVNWDRKGRVLV